MEKEDNRMEVRDIDVHEEKVYKRVSNKVIIFVGIGIIFVMVLIAIVGMYLAVYFGKPTGKEISGGVQSTSSTSKKDIQNLVELGNWIRFDESRDMPLDLTFDSRTKEFYYCEDSEPYMGYDVYEKYKFVSNKKIELYSEHDSNKEYATVISVDEDTLVIKIGDEENTFTNQAANYDVTKPFDYSSCDECEKIVKDSELGVDIRRVDGDTIHVAKGGNETTLDDLKISKDVKIYDVYVDEQYNDEGEIIHKCDIKEISKEDIAGLIDVVYPYGLIWFDNDKNIEKLVVFRVNSDYEVTDM